MSILEDILTPIANAGTVYFEAKRQSAEIQIAKDRAASERAAQEASLASSKAGNQAVAKFAKWAFYIAMGFAGLAVLTQFRRMWRGAK